MTGDTSCDVLVVGGGPGGSTVATMLAMSGIDVIVVEGKAFPRHHLGESLLAISMPLLDELGLGPELANQGFPRKLGAIFVWGGERKHASLRMTNPGYAYQVQRGIFDQILLRHAEACGARVLHEHWARDIQWRSGRAHSIRIHPSSGQPFDISASLVVDASGLFQFLPRKLALGEEFYGPKRVALSIYLTKAKRPGEPHSDDIVTEACEDGWLWFIPLSDGLTSVGFVGDEDDLGGDHRRFLADQIASSALVRSLCAGADQKEHIRLLKYRNHAVRSAWWQRGYVLVGDTGGFVDPLFSTGVHATLYSAVAAGAAIGSVVRGLVNEPDAAAWYDNWARGNYAKTRAMIRILYGAHPGQSRFWRSRWLGEVDEELAEAALAEAGVDGVDFFRSVRSSGGLDLPEPLARRLDEFRCRPRGVPIEPDIPLTLTPETERIGDWMRQGLRIVPCTVLRHARGRTHEIRSPAGSVLDQVIQRVDGQHTARQLIAGQSAGDGAAQRLRQALGVLLDGGLIAYRGSADSTRRVS
jgi:FAD-dependent halogenase